MNYKDFKVIDIFEVSSIPQIPRGYKVIKKDKGIPYIQQTTSGFGNGISGYLDREKTNLELISGNKIILGVDTSVVFYQPFDFYANKMIMLSHSKLNKDAALYIVSILRKLYSGYSYANKISKSIIEKTILRLPVTENGEINFEFMASRIRELEASRIRELEAYLKVAGLSDYILSEDENNILNIFKSNIKFHSFKVSDLFDVITRGKRLKSQDRIKGKLPFITAGVGEQGFSSYVGNIEVEVFPSNSLTIDMFGNVFYRSFEFGADDHVTVLHNITKKYDKEVLLFISSAIQKVVIGKFDYSRNFYPSDALDIEIMLPVDSLGNLDITFMSQFIKVQKKIAIKNVVIWKDKQIEIMKKVTSC
jgi:ferritin-like protein